MTREILQMVIAAHHGSLADGVDLRGEGVFFDKMFKKSDEKYHYGEVLSYLEGEDYTELLESSAAEIEKLVSDIKRYGFKEESKYFAAGLFVKYIYSCLIDADRLDALLFDTKSRYEPAAADWGRLISVFEKKISDFKKDNDINIIRTEISEICKAAADRETGIYRLSVPTGGGKTLSSLRFALYHALKKEKKRIIYVIPYLSITTQTTAVIRKYFKIDKNSDILLEHYSSVAAPETETEEEKDKRKLAAARWDNDIIVTTMVQFLETVMSAKAGALRKFHNMADSVIIFDEIQSLPINCIHLFNETASFLSKILNSTILLCTATQPTIDKTEKHNLLVSENPDFTGDYKRYEEKLRRTNIIVGREEKTIGELSAAVYERAKENGNCLCIVNLKTEARDVYKEVLKLNENNEFEIVHLSTSMCGKHRQDTLDKVKRFLQEKKKVICVSTQLIEAGVDISFACVVRATAGLDSILQAAGRCNRNREWGAIKNVYVYSIKDEKGLDKLLDIKKGKEITERFVREYPDADFLSGEMLEQFYLYYFYKRVDEMDYITSKKATVYEMLSKNRTGRNNYINRTGQNYNHIIAQAFATADECFSVIPGVTRTVVVYYGEAETLLDAFKAAKIDEKIKILRKLEGYSVSVYGYVYKKLEEIRAISLFDEDFGIIALDKHYYSDEYGVEKDAEMKNYII